MNRAMRKFNFLQVFLLFLAALFLLTNLAWAAPDEEKLNLDNYESYLSSSDRLEGESSSIGFLLVRYFLAVMGVIILTYVGLKFILKKYNYYTEQGSNWIEIIDFYILGANKGIYIVEINEKGYILGITDHNINVIDEIKDLETLEKMKEIKQFLNKKNDLKFHHFLQKNINKLQDLSRNQKGGQNDE